MRKKTIEMMVHQRDRIFAMCYDGRYDHLPKDEREAKVNAILKRAGDLVNTYSNLLFDNLAINIGDASYEAITFVVCNYYASREEYMQRNDCRQEYVAVLVVRHHPKKVLECGRMRHSEAVAWGAGASTMASTQYTKASIVIYIKDGSLGFSKVCDFEHQIGDWAPKYVTSAQMESIIEATTKAEKTSTKK